MTYVDGMPLVYVEACSRFIDTKGLRQSLTCFVLRVLLCVLWSSEAQRWYELRRRRRHLLRAREAALYGEFEFWLSQWDCMKDPADNECPLCIPGT